MATNPVFSKSGIAQIAAGQPPAVADQTSDLLAPGGPVVTRLLATLPEAMAIYAFGSRIHGTQRVDSDLDLAVLVQGYADPLQLWDLSSKLADVASCPVDLLDLRAASTVMQYQVLTTGQRLWSAGLQADLFACFVISQKQSLNAARAGLLTDIAKTGKIHG